MKKETVQVPREKEYTFTLSEWDKASRLADKQMKETNGHTFETILKTLIIVIQLITINKPLLFLF